MPQGVLQACRTRTDRGARWLETIGAGTADPSGSGRAVLRDATGCCAEANDPRFGGDAAIRGGLGSTTGSWR